MFQFPHLPQTRKRACIQKMCFHIRESPIKLARQLVEAYRRLATPFFGPYCQGIRHMLLIVQPV